MSQQSLSKTKKNPSNLKVHEWLAVIILITILLTLSAMAYLSQGDIGDKERLTPAFLSHQGKIEILIKGAVDHPGTYVVPSLITLDEVLRLAQVKPEADLRRFQLDRPIKRGRTLNIPTREMISIELNGVFNPPKKITVPKGSKVEDLLNLIDFPKDADLKPLQKKRKLKPDEVIIVPLKGSRA